MKAIIFTDMAGYHGFGRSAGAYRIASEWRSRGMEVKVVDCFNSFTLQQLKDIIVQNKTSETEFVGFSTTFLLDRENNSVWDNKEKRPKPRAKVVEDADKLTPTGLRIYDQYDLFSFIKSLGLKVVLGGWRTGTSDDPEIDYIYGPCEERYFPEFDFTKSQILYDESDHIMEGEDLPIEIARGCIFKCKFCFYHLNGKKLWEYVKSPQVLREEMMRNYINFGTTGYMFSDDTYNDSPEKITELAKMYKTLPFDMRFSTYARLDLMIAKPETQEILVESGLKSVFFGIETFNKTAGKFIGKGMDPDKVKHGLMEFRRKYPDILVYTSMIAGLPEETLEDMDESFKFLTEEAKVHNVAWSPLFINSGSDMSVNAEKYGYTKGSNDHRQWTRSDGLTYIDTFNWVLEKKLEYPGHPAGFTLYNRIHNMGYSHDEIMGLTWDKDGKTLSEESDVFRKNYMKKIF